MNVLFVYSLGDAPSPNKPLVTQQQMQFGLSYISAYLKLHGHQTSLMVLTRESRLTELDKRIREFKPGLVCFTAVATEYEYVSKVAAVTKNRYPRLFLMIGGVHVSLRPEEAMLEIFDAVCIGEGEEATSELIGQLEKGTPPAGIPNLWIKNGEKVEKNPTRPFMKDLDRLPAPDREMWLEWIERPSARCSILLGRGCPFQCTYCCNHALKKVSKGAYVRFRSPENVIAELEDVMIRFPGMEEVYFEVETFGANMRWAIQLCSAVEEFNKKAHKIPSYGVNLRITSKKDWAPLFAALKKAKFTFVNIGLESGSDKVRRHVLNRKYSNDDVVTAVNLARKYGFKVRFYNMVGLPGETVADFQETVRMNRQCLPDSHQLTIFYPYPGTNLYALCEEQGFIKNNLKKGTERYETVLDLPGFSKSQIEKSFIWFDYKAFRGYRPLCKILARVIVNGLHSDYRLNLLYRRVTRNPLAKRIKVFLESY